MNKQKLLNFGLLIALAIAISMIFSKDTSKGIIQEKEKKIAELELKISKLDSTNDSLKNNIVVLRDSLVKKDKQIALQDSAIVAIKTKGTKEREEIGRLSKSEADKALEETYPNIETRSKDILIDLQFGKESENKYLVAVRKTDLLQDKVNTLETINAQQEELIKNLETKSSSFQQILDEKNAEVKLLKKEIRKQKVQKIIIGGVAIAVVILVL